MQSFILCLAGACFAFAAGIFLTLSYIERPVWRLMRAPSSWHVPDTVAGEVHGMLRRVIHLLPPTMKSVMSLGTLALLVQAWQSGWAWLPLAQLGTLAVGLGYVLPRLGPRIAAVSNRGSEHVDAGLRRSVGELAALHHAGLAMVVAVLFLQLLQSAAG
ncbi:hypothetical protein P1J78_24285 [Psychromarinibacter sp. C21-152]|uniref:Uncharacterized protein n=1 Tax=Psychromarinibacter sediminicola TaxID=3033385 RepID=A0AAE3NXD2_9RHOB|nr:hypothetical protein [Psychromarinibacter sediminicola]MDF0603836.1 hypothetical protein [Psychromarinibacter sediminicola]